MRAGTAPAPAPAAGHAPAPERLGPRPLLFQPKTRLVWPLQLLIFGVQGIFWLGDQSLGGSPSTQGALGWGLSECVRLRKAVLGSPLCFNIHLSTKTSPTSFPARRRMEEPTPGPGKGKHPESSAQREPALGTKGFQSRETSPGCVEGHVGWWVDASLPEGSYPSVGHPQPCRRNSQLHFGCAGGGASACLGYSRVPERLQGVPLLWPQEDAEAEEEGAEQALPGDRGVEPGRGWMLNKAPFSLR